MNPYSDVEKEAARDLVETCERVRKRDGKKVSPITDAGKMLGNAILMGREYPRIVELMNKHNAALARRWP